jgi:hypothetical protein
MALKVKKQELTGQVMPWRCDLCKEPFEPDLKAICARCGRLCCPRHRRECGGGALCEECALKGEDGDS